MAQWRLQNPDNFPPSFHLAIRQPLGKHVIDKTSTRAAAIALQKRWRLFRFCLRGFSGTASGACEPLYDRRTSIHHNHESGRWELRLDVHESSASILRTMKVLANNS